MTWGLVSEHGQSAGRPLGSVPFLLCFIISSRLPWPPYSPNYDETYSETVSPSILLPLSCLCYTDSSQVSLEGGDGEGKRTWNHRGDAQWVSDFQSAGFQPSPGSIPKLPTEWGQVAADSELWSPQTYIMSTLK